METIVSLIPSRNDFRRGNFTLEIGYPWISYGAIIAIEGLLKPDHRVLEFGSGGSTIFWSNRTNSVRSYENNRKWLRRVQNQLTKNNVTFIFGDKDILIRCLCAEPNDYYTWILVDIDPYEFRGQMLRECVSKLKRGGGLIIDNYTESHLNLDFGKGWSVRYFDQINYAYHGTKICFKR